MNEPVMALRSETPVPNDQVLREILGEGFFVYTQILDLFSSHGLLDELRYYNDGKAWLCKVQYKKRTIVWMSVWEGFIQATIYIPQKYIEGIYSCGIDSRTADHIRDTPNTGKSKPCIFRGDTHFSLDNFVKVVEYKINNK